MHPVRSALPCPEQPISPAARSLALDAVRGTALFGVLLVNLLTSFRVSLFEQMFTFHTHPGQANEVVDIVMAWVFEFKAFALFSILFGLGIAVQVDRAKERNVSASPFLVRRFAALLAIGILHTLLIWNGDILVLYAVCGLLVIPFLRTSATVAGILGLTIVALSPYFPFFSDWVPSEAEMRAHAVLATRVYATGTFGDIAAFRYGELLSFIVPLLVSSLPRTLGLILVGVAVWRSGLLQASTRLLAVAILAGSPGAVLTTIHVWSRHTGQQAPQVLEWLDSYAAVLLAFSYGALLWRSFRLRSSGLVRMLAAAGRMALTNYIAQSVVFSFLFYGYGFGLFGKLGPAVAGLLGAAVFVIQTVASDAWLRYFRFGPAEWLWRTTAYRRWQPLRLHDSGEAQKRGYVCRAEG